MPSRPKKDIKEKPRERTVTDMAMFTSLSGLMKLRIAIGAILLLMTIAFALAITSEFAFSVALILITYLSLSVLFIKILLIKQI